jgi:hypothetical protein
VAKVGLEREALLQNAADGVNREQAISYQQFVLDFLLLAGLAGRDNDDAFSPPYWRRIESMLEFIASVMDVNGNVPMIGDADDGYAVRLSQEAAFCPYRSLLATGACTTRFQGQGRSTGRQTRWLLGAASDQYPIPANAVALPVRRNFARRILHIGKRVRDTRLRVMPRAAWFLSMPRAVRVMALVIGPVERAD